MRVPTPLSSSNFPSTHYSACLLAFFLGLTRLQRPMSRHSRHYGPDTGHDQCHADGVSETPAGEHLLDGHDHTESGHPDHVHDASREHHQHHCPAAPEALD